MRIYLYLYIEIKLGTLNGEDPSVQWKDEYTDLYSNSINTQIKTNWQHTFLSAARWNHSFDLLFWKIVNVGPTCRAARSCLTYTKCKWSKSCQSCELYYHPSTDRRCNTQFSALYLHQSGLNIIWPVERFQSDLFKEKPQSWWADQTRVAYLLRSVSFLIRKP